MITTVANVKLYLNITDSTQDARITSMIPLVESYIVHYRNKPFDIDKETQATIYPDGLELIAIQLIGLKLRSAKSDTKTSESLDGYSVTFGVDTKEKMLLSQIRRYAKVI